MSSKVLRDVDSACWGDALLW